MMFSLLVLLKMALMIFSFLALIKGLLALLGFTGKDRKMKTQDEWASIIEVHSCISVELSKQLALTEHQWHIRRALLKKLLNEIEAMDPLVDCMPPCSQRYLVVCRTFFSWLDDLQLKSVMIEKVKERFGEQHFFVRCILPAVKRGS